jgi:hypothetical protein
MIIILFDYCSLSIIVLLMTILVEDAITRSMVLSTYAPYLCMGAEVLPYHFWHFVLPSEEINAITLMNTI